MKFSFYLPTRIEYGMGIVSGLANEARILGIKRALIVTDKGIMTVGLDKAITEQLKRDKIEYEIYSEVGTNPPIENVIRGIDIYKEFRADGMIALGGGSSMDVAKSIGVVITNGGSIEEYEVGIKEIEKEIPPLITIPTTAGTGSEVTEDAVITDAERKLKMLISSFKICPALALVDPMLTKSMSPGLTAATGLDALSHSIEAYVSVRSEPFTNALAIHSIALIGKYIRKAVSNGDNLEARDKMMAGSLLAGVAQKAGCGAIHTIAHALSAHTNIHHGIACALLLPTVSGFNLSSCPDRYSDIAHALGKPITGSIEQDAFQAVSALKELLIDLKVPSLSKTGIEESMIPTIAESAANDRAGMRANPCKIERVEIEKILMNSYSLLDF